MRPVGCLKFQPNLVDVLLWCHNFFLPFSGPHHNLSEWKMFVHKVNVMWYGRLLYKWLSVVMVTRGCLIITEEHTKKTFFLYVCNSHRWIWCGKQNEMRWIWWYSTVDTWNEVDRRYKSLAKNFSTSFIQKISQLFRWYLVSRDEKWHGVGWVKNEGWEKLAYSIGVYLPAR